MEEIYDAYRTSFLTKEQIEHLRSVYDLSDMDKENHWNLMADLTDIDKTFGQSDYFGNIREDLLKYKNNLDLMMDWLKDYAMMDSCQFFR